MQGLMLLILVTAAFFTDARSSIIPNKLTLTAAAAGIIGNTVIGGWNGFVYSASGLIAGFVIFLLLYALGALGAGDVKLFAALGAITGVAFVLSSMMYSILYAGMIGLLLLVLKKKLLPTGQKIVYGLFSLLAFKDVEAIGAIKKGEHVRFPFMYAVVPGVATAWLYSNL